MEKFIPYQKLSKKEKRKMDLAKRQTWGELNPVTRNPQNSKAYNRNKIRNWKRDEQRTNSGYFFPQICAIMDSRNGGSAMKALTYIERGKFELIDKPKPEMYGKNLTFKTGSVDGCDCAEILALIEQGKIDTTPLITHRLSLKDIEETYRIFENKLDGVIKIAITPN